MKGYYLPKYIYIGAINFNISYRIIFTYNNLSSSSLSLVDIFSV
jgi:hypothetical protein